MTRSASPVRWRGVRRFVPPQHGAWAMLVVPWLAGVLTAGFHWPHLPLLGAWLSGYLLSYYVMQAVKTRRPQRFQAQLVAYGTPTLLLGGLTLLLRPQLLWFAPIYALLLAVNATYAWRRQERAVVNDLASVAQSSAMLLVAAAVADVPPTAVLPAFLAVLAYFTGTVLYVKTMIRERHSVPYRRVSVVYHLAVFALACWWHPLLGAFFGLALLRAWLLPGRGLRPKHVGILEIILSALLLATVTMLANGTL
jgi:hypothetical protein